MPLPELRDENKQSFKIMVIKSTDKSDTLWIAFVRAFSLIICTHEL